MANDETHTCLPLPAEAQTLLDWWLPRVRDELKNKLLSVVLFGSAAVGDYIPVASDLDVCSVLADPIRSEEAGRIGQIHDEMRKLFTIGGPQTLGVEQVIEGPYVPLSVAADENAVAPCFVAWGRTRRLETGNPVSAFDRYSLAHSGLCIWGEKIAFGPPSWRSLQEMLRGDLATLTDESQWHDSGWWYVAMICFVARSLSFWRDGAMLSKTRALERGVSEATVFAPAFELALRARRQGKPAAEAVKDQLCAAMLAIARPAYDILLSVAGG